ncbi:hypothetical protein [Marinobacterium lutimaris]|uniref:Uncharacterized protein n=1 Tax=Marinobacterium lutimaris TaxID=568106 RepID=A0A1H5Z4T8_9GAMM|nr:hypothetical protein [Marinobacterium lutimaris]SEG31543.1 hypothetical protein SAMN05444390_1012026 [Marinobacterium lutimaris]
MEHFIGEGFWSIMGALIGAFLGAFFGFITSAFLDYRRNIKLERAFYNETRFIYGHVESFFKRIADEYEKRKIDLDQGEKYSAPHKVDFSVFSELHLELYKTRKIPNYDHRRFVQNVKIQWDKVRDMDKGRVRRLNDDSYMHWVDHAPSLEVSYYLVDLLYYFEFFDKEKYKFKFRGDVSFKDKSFKVFEKYGLMNSSLQKGFFEAFC